MSHTALIAGLLRRVCHCPTAQLRLTARPLQPLHHPPSQTVNPQMVINALIGLITLNAHWPHHALHAQRSHTWLHCQSQPFISLNTPSLSHHAEQSLQSQWSHHRQQPRHSQHSRALVIHNALLHSSFKSSLHASYSPRPSLSGSQ